MRNDFPLALRLSRFSRDNLRSIRVPRAGRRRAWDRHRKIRSISSVRLKSQHREAISTRRTRGKRFTRGYIEFDEARGKGTPDRAGRPIATRGESSVTLIIESASP